MLSQLHDLNFIYKIIANLFRTWLIILLITVGRHVLRANESNEELCPFGHVKKQKDVSILHKTAEGDSRLPKNCQITEDQFFYT